MPLLTELNLRDATIISYSGKEGTIYTTYKEYPDNAIPIDAFAGKKSLTSVILPSSVTSIGESAFWGCTGLTGSLNLPSNVMEIGDSAFDGFGGFYTVDEDNPNYSSIDGVLFNKTQTLLLNCPTSRSGNYTIPSTVTSIGRFAFSACTSLKSIIIPSSVTAYGYAAFYACWGLTSISVDSASPVDLSSFQGVFTALYTQIIDLYVPVGSINAYKTADQWKEFKNIKEFLILDTEVIKTPPLSIYPNPATNWFTISELKGKTVLQLFDINGKLVLTKEIDSNEFVPVSKLTKGVYVVRINSMSGYVEKKLVKR